MNGELGAGSKKTLTVVADCLSVKGRWERVRRVMAEHGVDASQATDEELRALCTGSLPRLFEEIWSTWARTIVHAVGVVRDNIGSLGTIVELFSTAVNELPPPKDLLAKCERRPHDQTH